MTTMAIKFNETEKIFSIHTKNSTYQMKVDAYGFLLHLYYGRRTDGTADYLLTYADRGFSGNPYDVGQDRTYSLDALPQEFPCRGNGDFRSPALDVKAADGVYGCDLRYAGHRVSTGKYSIPGLPAVHAGEGEAETLEIILKDEAMNLQVCLLYGILPELDVITRAVRVQNDGKDSVFLEKVQSACLDFVGGRFDLLTFYGRHAMERNMQRTAVTHVCQRIGSRRGTSSHQYNPLLLLAEQDATEEHGACYAMSFVYSGGFQGEAERDQYNQTRMMLGLCEEQFSYPLAPGSVFHAPEVIMTYSGEGLGQVSRNLHKCINRHVCRGNYKNLTSRPILVNSWEASYFHFDGQTIRNLAREAAALGVEMLVMDDGWFGKRDDDNSGLGDWHVNEKKLGCSLKELVDDVNALGLKFGIWFEPEMINEDSALYRAHPDWALARPNRKPVRGRGQLVLDFSRKEVVDAIFDQVCDVLDQANIEYLKWDINRSICDVYTHGENSQETVLYDYMLGLYDFLERLINRYPNLLIEGCSGGGGRFDAGMLYYTPQIWCSDNTDAVDRTRIQYGTSFGYPVSTVGSHVSAVPNHQTGRVVSLKTRGIVAMSGTFGYELDFGRLSDAEKDEIRGQIATYKDLAGLIQNGDYHRLSNPFTDETAAWEVVSEDKDEALVFAVMLEIHGNMPVSYIKVRGLAPGALYMDMETKKTYSSDILMESGLPLVAWFGSHQSFYWHLKRQA